MRMDEIGWHSTHSADFRNERPHGAGDYVFLLIKAPCVVAVNGELQQFPAYTWILYTPDAYQHYGAAGDEYADDWMHFAPNTDAEEALLLELQIPLNTPVALPNGTEISKLLRDICFEFYSTHLHRAEVTDLMFRMLLYRLHAQLVRCHTLPETESVSDRLRWIKAFIYRKPFDSFTAERFAGELNMTVDDFYAAYLAENGSAFADDLIGTRMQYIASQMRVHIAENQTVEEIAQLCCYASEAEFVEEFTRFIGKTPQQYLDELSA